MAERVGSGTCAGGVKGHPLDSCKVIVRRANYSAFNGYRYTPSDYSAVRCFVEGCGARWRTKAGYVDLLPDAPTDWFNQGGR
jgi:hypothetical protein